METKSSSIPEEVQDVELKIVGTRKSRYDANLKVSGAAVFGTDIWFPNLLYGKIFRSAQTHARIVKLDVTKAESYPGVRAVVTVNDFPDVMFGFAIQDQRFLPRDKVLFNGQAICAVAADTLEIAEKAIQEIEVEYEPLPVVLSIEDALMDDSPAIHPDVVPVGSPPYKSKNVASYTKIHRGNIERAFRTADFVLEERYETPQVHQSYIEPHAATADVDPKGGWIKIWTSTQSPFWVRNSVAEILSIPVSQVEVIPTHTGGGFGAKISGAFLEPLCVMLSKKAKRPVKIVLTRSEEFIAGTPRPPMHIWIKSGVKDGKIVARQGKSIVDSGVFGSEGAVYSNISALALIGPYNIPNVETEGICVYTNKQPAGAFRAPGTMETAFGVESHTDMLAEKAKISPLDFRLDNVLEDGNLGPTGQIMQGVGLKDALMQAAKRIGYKELRSLDRKSKLGDLRRGVGIACGLIPTVGIHTSGAIVKINEDGKVALITGSQDSGAGAVTGLAMIAAEELGVNLRDVIVQPVTTDLVPWDGGAQGSRTTYTGGNAVLMATKDAKHQLLKAAAVVLKVSVDKLIVRDGAVYVVGTKNCIKFPELVTKAQYNAGGPILGRGSYAKDFPEYDKNSVEGYLFVPSLHDPLFIAHIAEVEVNVLSGEVRLVRYVAAHDLGRCINPLGAEGQIQGGVAQGIGYALTEEMYHNKVGITTNPNFTDYKLPTILSVPEIETIIVEGHYGGGPYGAKGVGEGNIVPPSGATANAVYDATGARMKKIPMTPERVLEALDEISVKTT